MKEIIPKKVPNCDGIHTQPTDFAQEVVELPTDSEENVILDDDVMGADGWVHVIR